MPAHRLQQGRVACRQRVSCPHPPGPNATPLADGGGAAPSAADADAAASARRCRRGPVGPPMPARGPVGPADAGQAEPSAGVEPSASAEPLDGGRSWPRRDLRGRPVAPCGRTRSVGRLGRWARGARGRGAGTTAPPVAAVGSCRGRPPGLPGNARSPPGSLRPGAAGRRPPDAWAATPWAPGGRLPSGRYTLKSPGSRINVSTRSTEPLSYSLSELPLSQCLMRAPSGRSLTLLLISWRQRCGTLPLAGTAWPKKRSTSTAPKVVMA